jgi:hypothetical protein
MHFTVQEIEEWPPNHQFFIYGYTPVALYEHDEAENSERILNPFSFSVHYTWFC